MTDLRIQLRHGTAAQWTSANPVLAPGEPGVEIDTRKIKYGDGVTAWNSLPYPPDIGVTDHGLLTGLADDDHPQYLNNARGDARYDALGDADAAEAAAVSTAAADATTKANAAEANAIATAAADATTKANAAQANAIATAATDATTKANNAQATAIATAATDATTKADAAQAFAIQRANHSGAQAISTVTGLQTALDAKAPLASPTFTGAVSMQERQLRNDLAAAYQIPNPQHETQIAFRRAQTAFGSANWVRFAEMTLVNAADQSTVRAMLEMQVDNSTTRISAGARTITLASFRADPGPVFGAAFNQWMGGRANNSTYYWRTYTDTDGSGRPRMTVYIYDSTGALDKMYDGTITFVSSHSDTIIKVWPAGDTPTTTDPAGTATETTRQNGFLTASAFDSRLFFNSSGTVTDPSKLIGRSDASTSYNLAASDHMARIRFTAATTVTVTVNTSVVSDGFYCELLQEGAGQVVVVAGSGMTQRTAGTAKTRALYAPLAVVGVGSVSYYVFGDMSAT